MDGTELKEVKLPSKLETLGGFASTLITKLKTPKSLKVIHKESFRNSKLNRIRLNKGLTELAGFENLVNVEVITLPETLKIIHDGTFSNNRLKEIKLPSHLKVLGGFSGKESGIKEVILPESLEVITNSAFNYNPHITKIKLPKNLVEINGFNSTNISELIIPEKVIKVGGFNETLIKDIKLPENLESFEGFHESKIKKLILPKFIRFTDISKSHWGALEEIEVYSKYLVKSKWWNDMKEDDFNQLIKLVDKTNVN